ncbi:NlpC/P60 family protein [Planosporangium sp. 12N6]|uniref:C40 family peptidase n=1 Tax=Planosporangium spinosum TaxID=3402278 RepID=UPI003CF1A1A0
MAPNRVLTALHTVAFTAIAGVTALLVAIAPAHADPAPAPGDIEAQIEQKWNTLEPTIEQYNAVHGQLTANKAKADQLQAQLQPLQLQVDMAMSTVSNLAASVYKGGRGSTVNAILSTNSPTALAEQLTLLDMVARSQRDQISTVAAARDKFAADKTSLDNLIAQQAKQDADLAAKKKQIEEQLSQLQRMRQQAYGSSGSTGVLKPTACPVEFTGGPGGTAAQKACGLIGKPYYWGAAGPNGYDCSGLTMVAWQAAGVRLDHLASAQRRKSTAITRDQLRTGDLIFFGSDNHHVGIYVGGGWMVHAPHTGDYVRMAQLTGYYANNVSGYGRPA